MQDNIFLLSILEAQKYFISDENRRCVPTAYAIKNGACMDKEDTIDNKHCCWWNLRSPGRSNFDAAFVSHLGAIETIGNYNAIEFVAVRPALWINL